VAGAFYRRRGPPGIVEGAPYRSGDLIAGRYEVKEVAGSGPVGFVFRCRDKELDVEVAVKLINPKLLHTDEEREQFFKVIRMGRRLSHQNLARITEDGEDNGWPFYTTAFLDGLSLRKIIDLRLAKGQVFTLQEAEPILGQIANALTSGLKQGPHTNLKPENVIVLPDLLKVTDFGLGAGLPRTVFIQAQRARNAERYYAPEMIAGGKLDARVDVYALGVILGELLSGLTPEENIPELDQYRQEIPRAVAELYRRAVSPNPQTRPATSAELFQELSSAAKRELASDLTPRDGFLPPPVPATLQGKVPEASPVHLRGPDEKTVPSGPAAKGKVEEEAPPLDATQPLDVSLLPFLMASLPTDATQPVDLSALPALPSHATQPMKASAALKVPSDARPTAPSAPAAVPDATQPIQNFLSKLPKPAGPPDATMPLDPSMLPLSPANPDNASTQAMPSSALPAPPGVLSLFQGQVRRSNATLWLILLMVSGLIIGTVGGYLVLNRLRHRGSGGPTSPSVTSRPPSPGDDRDARTGSPDSSGASGVKPSVACPGGMKLIPQGTFKMGTAKDDPMMGFDERGLAPIEVAAFCIDEYEYPNQLGQAPMVNVSWSTAKSLCEAKGKRICTEQEWEKACKGPQSLRFPYSQTFDANACNTEDSAGEDREVAPSGKFLRCRSAYGVADLSGNVAEWTSTVYASNADKTQKGGSFDRPDYAARCSARRNGAPSLKAPQVGFRCCGDIP
jgi:eukaryotic-like serine/threonine-protein kinase